MLQKGDKKLIHSWAFYDWANSVYSLVISTAVFPIYYETITETESGLVNFLGIQFDNTSLYTYALSFSFLIVAFISPILSGIADYVGNKKSYMQFFCYLGSISVMSLYFFDGVDSLWIGIVFSILASIGFWGSLVFYNAFLPEVAYNDQQDRVSALGFIYGYIGSVLLLIFNLSMVMKPEWYGISEPGMAPRISFLTVGIWWMGFAQVTFKRLPDGFRSDKKKRDYIFKGFQELKKVVNELKDQPVLLNFLTSFFLYSVGVQSTILLATIYGKSEIGLSTSSLILTIIVIQLVGIAGAYIFSNLSGKIGNISTLKITIIIWALACLSAYFLDKNDPNVQLKFYVISGFIGLVLGAIQTLSRSTYSKLLPENTLDPTTYFSFFDVTEKVAIVWGTFIFGLAISITASMRLSILLLCIFFVASFIVLSFMKKTKYVH
ncbi:MFS transporter [Lutimonas saemankumensis]|uniref:MFS transporter n=1 Tax=Lutimonas saemankumensis TaxID=483016 RepID=UPI001CD6E324|nr:MFS transporter [Lutimonas saemankumensis]MCA0932341.1 MFS transporter [Lutimonas saemankumensis]